MEKKGISNRIITSSVKKNGRYFINADTTDKNGAFTLPLPQGVDSLQMLLQVTDFHNIKTTDDIKTDSFQYPHLSTPVVLKQQFTVSEGVSDYIKKHLDDTAFIYRRKDFLNL